MVNLIRNLGHTNADNNETSFCRDYTGKNKLCLSSAGKGVNHENLTLLVNYYDSSEKEMH